MKIWITLTEDGPSIWMLGERDNIIVNLNFVNTGPVEVDFDQLDEGGQKKVLDSVHRGEISSDVSFEDLYKHWNSLNVQKAKTKEEVVKVEKETAAALYLKEKAEKDKKEDEKIEFILTGSIAAVRTSIKKEKDTRFLRKMLKKEQETKNRTNIVKHIESRIVSAEEKIADKLRKTKVKLTKHEKAVLDNADRLASVFDVVESDEETIEISFGKVAEIAAR